ncbi:response regulator [Enterovirga rhinocerotis]|uniref:Response regulator receiver domain-containing protein n=1 Tax=Enterovirga rhinocerotis TaxID=1339210 RepID=A0A4V3DZ28_9HYPH|nr:response regulator [Enterovirga rhinocerotis]TDR94889.1 response regulator receiver domain-containing protein [Enterovirga rhinocerotis]
MKDTPRPPPNGFAGLRVLVVEDEVAIALLLEDMLMDVGIEVVGPASRLAEGRALAEQERLDVAILDVNVAGEPVYPIVDILAARGIRFIFSTGYGAGGIDPAWRDRPVLQKPFSQAELEAALAQTVAVSGP